MVDVLRRNHVTVEGPSHSAGTLVFAHGFGTDQTAWSAVAESFREQYRVVRFDHVGAGRSDPEAFSPNRYTGPEAYADDLLEILDALTIRDAVLVAHSMSGMIGVVAATRRPGCFSKLILVGASARYLDEPETGYRGGFNRADLDVLYRAMETHYYAWASGFARHMMANPDQPDLGTEFAATLAAIRPDIALTVLRHIFESDLRDLLPLVRQPTLVVQTRQDHAVPIEAAEELARRLPDGRLVVIDAEGHLPHLSAADEVVAAIRSFL